MTLQEAIHTATHNKPNKYIMSIVETNQNYAIYTCDMYGNIGNQRTNDHFFYIAKDTPTKKKYSEVIPVPEQYKSYRQIVEEELLNTDIIVDIVQNDMSIIRNSIDALYIHSRLEESIPRLYTMFSYMIYLVATRCPKADTKKILKDPIVLTYLLGKSDMRIQNAAMFAYETDFIKDYLRCSNTIFAIADAKQLGEKADIELYKACNERLIKLQEKTYEELFGNNSKFFDVRFWLDIIEYIEKNIVQEREYIEDTTSEPSERVKNCMGLSKAILDDIQSRLSYNKTYKMDELV